MSLFMDVHTIDGGVGAEDVAAAHLADLATQGDFGVNYLRYWVDEAAGKIFCLVDAPDAALAVLEHVGPDTLVDVVIADPAAASAPAGEGADAPVPTGASASGPRPLRALVTTPDPGLATLLDSLLAGVMTAPDLAHALAALRADPRAVSVTPTPAG